MQPLQLSPIFTCISVSDESATFPHIFACSVFYRSQTRQYTRKHRTLYLHAISNMDSAACCQNHTACDCTDSYWLACGCVYCIRGSPSALSSVFDGSCRYASLPNLYHLAQPFSSMPFSSSFIHLFRPACVAHPILLGRCSFTNFSGRISGVEHAVQCIKTEGRSSSVLGCSYSTARSTCI
jgi:hypothetical protein